MSTEARTDNEPTNMRLDAVGCVNGLVESGKTYRKPWF